MKKLMTIIFCFGIISCNYQENLKKIIAEQKKDSILQANKNDSIKLKIKEDSILITKFKKWIDANLLDTAYINVFFIRDIETDRDYLSLKTNYKTLCVKLVSFNESRLKHNKLISLDIKRIDANFDMHFNDNEINIYDPVSTYFKLSITDDHNKLSTFIFKKYHANQEEDKNLIKTIYEHISDKIQVQEFFARENKGHFEDDKMPDDKLVRTFYLSEENKIAIKETYDLFTLLSNK